jgi:hypothetical protein
MLAALFRDLAPFTPTLVGTFPLGLAIDESDIDIACFALDAGAFETALRAALASASIELRISHAGEAFVASFSHDGTPYEIYAAPRPVHEQAGFRHMIVEGRLLAIGGASLRERVLLAKRAGTKTEPAFAAILALEGDPYAALLALEAYSDADLRRLVTRI